MHVPIYFRFFYHIGGGIHIGPLVNWGRQMEAVPVPGALPPPRWRVPSTAFRDPVINPPSVKFIKIAIRKDIELGPVDHVMGQNFRVALVAGQSYGTTPRFGGV